MNEHRRKIFSLVFVSLLATATILTTTSSTFAHGKIVVTNRGSASISVIDVKTDTVTGTYALPDKGEPMYVAHSSAYRRMFVGDRTNDRVVVFWYAAQYCRNAKWKETVYDAFWGHSKYGDCVYDHKA